MGTRTTWIALAGLASAGLVAAWSVKLGSKPHQSASALADTPSPEMYRYRGDPEVTVRSGPTLDEAIEVYRRRITIDPSPQELAELAALLLNRGDRDARDADLDESEELAKQSLALLPLPNAAVLTLARLASLRHDFHGALGYAEVAQRHGLDSTAIAMVAGYAHLALGQLVEAQRAADTAAATRPRSSTVLLQALVAEARGNHEAAASGYARAVRLEEIGVPRESARVRALWARFLMNRGNVVGARVLVDEALRIAPDEPLATGISAELSLRAGRPIEARAKFETDFLTTGRTRYLIDQARAVEAAGDLEQAQRLRSAAVRNIERALGDGQIGHRLELVEVLSDRCAPEDLTRAAILAREELARRDVPEVRYQLARALWLGGRASLAKDVLAPVLERGFGGAQLFELAALIERETDGKPKPWFDEATALDPRGRGWRRLGLQKK